MLQSAHNKITSTVYIFKTRNVVRHTHTHTTRLECSPKRIKHTANHFISNAIVVVVVVCQFYFYPIRFLFYMLFLLGYSATGSFQYLHLLYVPQRQRHTIKVLAKLLTLSSCAGACFVCTPSTI